MEVDDGARNRTALLFKLYRDAFPRQSNAPKLQQPKRQKVVLTGIQYHFGPGAETGPDRPSRALEPSDRHLHTPKQPFHFKYHIFSCRIRPSPAVSGRFRPYSYVFQSIGAVRCTDAGVTAEYGPARAQKNQTGKWYPQIPVDHTTLQINQRVVNTTLIPVKVKHWLPFFVRPPSNVLRLPGVPPKYFETYVLSCSCGAARKA